MPSYDKFQKLKGQLDQIQGKRVPRVPSLAGTPFSGGIAQKTNFLVYLNISAIDRVV